jgi:hypothetical protein
VKIIFDIDIEAESTKGAAEKIHKAFHEIAAYADATAKHVGDQSMDYQQQQKTEERKEKATDVNIRPLGPGAGTPGPIAELQAGGGVG